MRKAKLLRTTTETDIRVNLNLDGQGRAKISTGIPFLDHMLTLVARHGAMDLELTARGDLEVDQHHTVEDTGIVLGEAVRKALGSKRGILRAHCAPRYHAVTRRGTERAHVWRRARRQYCLQDRARRVLASR